MILRTALLAMFLAAPALAQTGINLGNLSADPSQPVEIEAEQLNVVQDTGKAVFSGNVVVGQGDLRLRANQIEVTYDDTTGDVTFLTATGGVTFVTPTEEAEAQRAVYDLKAETLTLSGNVLLSQGPSAIMSERMDVNLATGTAQMSGKVRSVLQGQ